MGQRLQWAGRTTMSVLAAWAIAGLGPQELSAQSPSRGAAGQESAAADGDVGQALKALNTKVWGLMKDGRIDEAITAAEQALSTSQATYGAEHPVTAEHMLLLGNVYVSSQLSQQQERAEKLLQGAIDIFEQNRAAQDFSVARGLVALSHAYRSQGKLDEAEDAWQRAEQMGGANPLWKEFKAQQPQPQGPR